MMRINWIGAALAVVLMAIASGCGSAQSSSRGAGSPRRASAGGSRPAGVSAGPRHPAPFAWLAPAPAPAAWSLARLAGTATLAYPRSWHRIESDPGTVSAAVVVPRTGLIVEYLNVTPKQTTETLANWSRFRPAHNQEEGDAHEQVVAAARGVRFRDGQGSCVIDRYRTSRARYQEIACLVRAPAGETVIVAAGLAARWRQEAPTLERAVSAFVA
jgi:hypothetical protein